MSGRIIRMRRLLYDELKRIDTPGDWDNIINCIGMFTYSGMTPEQVSRMINKHSVYMLALGGRMSMCGLTEKNIPYVAAAIKETVEAIPAKWAF